MTWFDVPLTEEQTDVIGVVDAVAAKYGPLTDDSTSEDVDTARGALADSGLWALGFGEDMGGGGADLDLRLTAVAALGRSWPALAWASAQAHAAAEVLGPDPAHADLIDGLRTGRDQVCVVVDTSWAVDVEVRAGHLRGSLKRLDPASSSTHVLLLSTNTDELYLISPDQLTALTPLRLTGLAGAQTISCEVDAEITPLSVRVDVASALARLQLAGAAIAAGLAYDAARRAVAYAGSRRQFGAPLTALPTVQAALSAMVAASVDALERVLSTTERSPRAAAAALVTNCESAISVAATAVQTHGGYGYLAEYEVERLLRDAVSMRAATDAANAARQSALTLAAGPAHNK